MVLRVVAEKLGMQQIDTQVTGECVEGLAPDGDTSVREGERRRQAVDLPLGELLQTTGVARRVAQEDALFATEPPVTLCNLVCRLLLGVI